MQDYHTLDTLVSLLPQDFYSVEIQKIHHVLEQLPPLRNNQDRSL